MVVSTDDDQIADAALSVGARIVRRPEQLAGDLATSESAVLHALDALAKDGVEPLVTVFVQCTSPFIDPSSIDAAIARVLSGDADVVFSAVETFEFLWRRTEAGAEGINHDSTHRPRRQDREPHFRETGAFYVLRTAGLRASGHRFFGRQQIQPVPALHAVEIDSLEDLDLARALAPTADRPEPIDVDAVITDFDGVHTDDHMYVDQDGHETVRVSLSDGMGIALLRRAGVRLLVLSTERNPVVAARAAKLAIAVQQGVDDKAAALKSWLAAEGIDPARAAYLGNDLNDLACLESVGWPVATPDAHWSVRAAARVVLSHPGGSGAVRDLCERVLLSRKEANDVDRLTGAGDNAVAVIHRR